MHLTPIFKRLAVFLLTVGLIVSSVGAVATLYHGSQRSPQPREPLPTNPEFNTSRINPDRLAANGTVTGIPRANGSVQQKQVLIDMAHQNAVQREDIWALVGGLVSAGHRVQLIHERRDLDQRLRTADAYVVIDPGRPYRDAEITRVNQFTQRGGRVLLVAEPNIKQIQRGLFGTSVETERSRITGLASSYGVAFDTEFIYNTQRNDGNYQNVLAKPAPGANLSDVDIVATSIVAPVYTNDGQRLLVAARGSRQLGHDDPGRYPIAVQNPGRNVTAVGDSSLFGPVRSTVADNEDFIGHLATFLVSGSRIPYPTSETNRTSPTPDTLTANTTKSQVSSPSETPTTPQTKSPHTPQDT